MIERVGFAPTDRLAAPRPRGPTAGFAVAGSRSEPAGIALAGTAPAATLEGLLALQEADRENVQDRAARRHGQATLAALGALQRAMLSGDDPAETLTQLGTLARAMPPVADPALHEVLAAITLRARVELARRGR